MTHDPRRTSVSIALLVIGTTLNALGIALTGAGAVRYLLMGLGLALLLTAVVRLVSQRPDASDDPPP